MSPRAPIGQPHRSFGLVPLDLILMCGFEMTVVSWIPPSRMAEAGLYFNAILTQASSRCSWRRWNIHVHIPAVYCAFRREVLDSFCELALPYWILVGDWSREGFGELQLPALHQAELPAARACRCGFACALPPALDAYAYSRGVCRTHVVVANSLYNSQKRFESQRGN